MKSENLLLIFTKNPEIGKVKTRLAKKVGNKVALDIYKFLLQHTFSVTKDLKVSKEVYYSEEILNDDLWDRAFFGKKLQQGEDLGERMENAFRNSFESGYKKVVIIGSDLFDLQKKDLETAFENLDTSDFVLGPAEDGGYYLFGMNKMDENVFRNKKWGTDSVFGETMKDLETKKVSLLEVRNDIDTFEDVKEYKALQHLLK